MTKIPGSGMSCRLYDCWDFLLQLKIINVLLELHGGGGGAGDLVAPWKITIYMGFCGE